MEPDSALSKEPVMVCLRVFVSTADASLKPCDRGNAANLYLSCRML